MVDFNHKYKTNTTSLWPDYLFYVASFLLSLAVFSYLIFNFKISLQDKSIQEIESKSSAYLTYNQQTYEQKVFDYKKKIDDFAMILGNHKISSNIFSFIEERTLPNVWFSSFDMQESASEIKLSGQAQNLEVLSRQTEMFEKSQDYVKNITILNSNTEANGTVDFVITLSLKPSIFSYGALSSSAGNNLR